MKEYSFYMHVCLFVFCLAVTCTRNGTTYEVGDDMPSSYVCETAWLVFELILMSHAIHASLWTE